MATMIGLPVPKRNDFLRGTFRDVRATRLDGRNADSDAPARV